MLFHFGVSVLVLSVFSSFSAQARDLNAFIQQLNVHLSSPKPGRTECDSQDDSLFSTPNAFPFDLTRHPCLFANDVIVAGASVSADTGVSPIAVLQQSQPIDRTINISNQAVPGSMALSQVPQLISKKPNSGSVVFAIDLFFWDGRNNGCPKSLEMLEDLFRWSKENNVTIVLGNLPDNSSCANQLNEAMQACNQMDSCRLVDLQRTARQIKQKGYYEVGATRFSPREIQPDGLHFSRIGAVLFAEEILKSMDQRPLNCSE